MKRVLTVAAVAAFGLLLGCEPSRENIVDTAEPMRTSAPEGVKEAPGTHEAATSSASSAVTETPATSATETATETAAQQNTRTQ